MDDEHREARCGMFPCELIDGHLGPCRASPPPLRYTQADLDAAVAKAVAAERDKIRAVFRKYACSDGNCLFRDGSGGMHTNGGCRSDKGRPWPRDYKDAIREIGDIIRARRSTLQGNRGSKRGTS